MSDYLSQPCTAFVGTEQLAAGALIDVALEVKAAEGHRLDASILVFDDASGSVLDLDLRGTTAEIVVRLTERGRREATAAKTQMALDPNAEPRGRGRPKLGVVAREVTLLPRHWEWLSAQPGGASQALRRLVDAARRSDGGQTQTKAAREAAYRFLTALAGDLPGYEGAIRSLFAGEEQDFADRMNAWPPDVRRHALKLATGLGKFPATSRQ
ncbi:DUF2239 family protein [Bosea sp. PAMC 26642]|uniref:DUF2239 family protein n=1 Tax=Bosea sp. (strain PAMC 26642) TaxID=1792307 RepID=UPI0007701F0C|nr:DUF2239 family protein [Bosea sp. PAMC 26642]AMJ59529.1 hypothetical protein AXW83_03720 [Bosea sp. PAMC 26642]